ncbi:hypothetical protein [Streptomyces sp. NBC_01198]|uniref:hypothetical protein n=1 Tax=Streptomyces sp. NBC_01198 TaxID=2903769 RepID=UPI002E1353C3|nr:hypothetical protein OG702_06990 [Streptomyces sp. NBC_01198]
MCCCVWPTSPRPTPDLNGNATSFIADKEWFDQLFPTELGRSEQTSGSGSDTGGAGAGSDSTDQSDDSTTTVQGQSPPADPRDRLAELRRELPARIELAEGIYQHAIGAANALLADFDEASRLRSGLGEDPLPADQRIQWMERLASARETAQKSATVLTQAEAMILQV